MVSVHERFWSRVDKAGAPSEHRPDLGPCWLWTGHVNPSGYGSIKDAGRQVRVHRWAYEHEVGPIPDGLTIDHLCRVRHCVRPSHLEPCTRGENVLRGDTLPAANLAKTECPKGHPYDEANTLWQGRQRFCRECNRRAARAYRAANIDEVRRRNREAKRRKRAAAS